MLLIHSLRINAGAATILRGLDPQAHEAFQLKADLKALVADLRAGSSGAGGSGGAGSGSGSGAGSAAGADFDRDDEIMNESDDDDEGNSSAASTASRKSTGWVW